jgi:hypothetical protein
MRFWPSFPRMRKSWRSSLAELGYTLDFDDQADNEADNEAVNKVEVDMGPAGLPLDGQLAGGVVSQPAIESVFDHRANGVPRHLPPGCCMIFGGCGLRRGRRRVPPSDTESPMPQQFRRLDGEDLALVFGCSADPSSQLVIEPGPELLLARGQLCELGRRRGLVRGSSHRGK